VVTLSSSDTEEALELLFPCPPRDPVSHASEPSSNCYSDQFEDWPEANDTAVGVYIALTADALSSVPRWSMCHMMLVLSLMAHLLANLTQGQLQRESLSGKMCGCWCSRRKCNKMKIDAGCTHAAPTSHSGLLFATDFDKSEW
jgi:hypothetical protein